MRIALAEPRPERLANGGFDTRGYLVVLADDAGGRELPIWLLGRDSHRFTDDTREAAADELTGRLLSAAGTRVTSVGLAELGPEVTVARIGLATPDGPRPVAARLADKDTT